MADVSSFFNADKIAVVGASRDEKKVGHVIFKNLLLSGKKIFPVNPNAKEILSHKCYADILEIPYEIDLVVVAVPAKLVPLVLRQCQQKKIKSAIITSAGFAENGNPALEKHLLQIAEESGIKILGPNSYGIIDVKSKTNSTYFRKIPPEGDIAFISQSGAIASAVLDKGQKLSHFVSVGNCAQLDPAEFIDYFSKDKKTKIIALYLESLKENRGKNFIDACKNCKKPIIILKAGKSKAGAAAAKTHTAALSSEEGVYSGIFKQVGAIEVSSIKELFAVAEILEKYGKLKNEAIIITNAGGLGVLTSDACSDNKIKIHTLSPTLIEKLSKVLSPNWSHRNPIDLVGDALALDYKNAFEILEGVHSFFIVLLTPQNMTEPLETAKIVAHLKSPVFTCFLGGEQVTESKKYLKKNGVINFDDVEEMCSAIEKTLL